tara:strand:+ start:50035 stop:50355 length:321 start_codon:yes stop_codon:yes gene_type:complete
MNILDIRNIDNGSKLLIETTNALYDINILDNKDGIIEISGGYKIEKTTTAVLMGACWKNKRYQYEIRKNMTMELFYNDDKLRTARVLNVVVYGPNDQWHYDMEWNK